jgi:hypothetical protein
MTAQFAVLFVTLVDKTPTDNRVTAGWGAFGVFMLMVVAVALLGWSLSRHLKKAQRNEDEGLFDPSDKRPRRTTI